MAMTLGTKVDSALQTWRRTMGWRIKELSIHLFFLLRKVPGSHYKSHLLLCCWSDLNHMAIASCKKKKKRLKNMIFITNWWLIYSQKMQYYGKREEENKGIIWVKMTCRWRFINWNKCNTVAGDVYSAGGCVGGGGQEGRISEPSIFSAQFC